MSSTTTCWDCGQDYPDRDMFPLPDEGELCPNCVKSRARTDEIMQAKRTAFETGAHWFYQNPEVPQDLGWLLDEIASVAETLYPLTATTKEG